ncbi:hypothetical protein ACFZBU_40590 [Embleya sp. NPDC008237]|uniref:hypothetical protein n=1 Tax=Embleya sp. NPDC008237 TaxID=3363978 RepID=UPI0036F16AD0
MLIALGAMGAQGTSAVAAISPSTPVAAQSGGWLFVETYVDWSTCVDAGQEYQREGWHEWKCSYEPIGVYRLFIR